MLAVECDPLADAKRKEFCEACGHAGLLVGQRPGFAQLGWRPSLIIFAFGGVNDKALP
jgi:hypothetical protein